MSHLKRKTFWFERRLNSLHAAFTGEFSAKLFPKIAILFGLGISYLPSMAKWNSIGNKIESIWLIPREEAQLKLELFLTQVRRTKSLEIRNGQAPLDYSDVGGFVRLKNLSIEGQIEAKIDLSKCSKLMSLSSNSASVKFITGISGLKNLKIMHLKNVSSSWLITLPKSIEKLFLYGVMPTTFNLASSPRLKLICLANSKKLDLRMFTGTSESVSTIILANTVEISNINDLAERFPNLRKIRVSNITPRLEQEIERNCLKQCQIVSF